MKYYLGIDLGGTNIAAGVVDENYKIIAQASVRTNSPRPADDIADDMAFVAMEALKKAEIDMNDIEWVGVGAPGSINQDTGIVEYSNNLGFLDVPLKKMLEERMQKTVYIENDANAAAYGEYKAGSAKSVDISVMVTLGTGVGGGIVINNKIYTGFNYCGAELGHAVIKLDGRPCTCGRRGCLEAYASATGLIQTTKELMQENKDSALWEICGGDISRVNGRTAFDGVRQDDATAKKVVDLYVKQLACGITNIINIFQPDMLCIGGGISREGDNLLNPLKEIINQEVYSRNSERNTKIVVATLGNDAGIIGAALLGLSH
ncbi:ROK family protein [Paludicola sp. MB14-C6]|uniref:ROK family protein n=1 Tax=Paludihabitans sp. MB14-C6 TaxID=3070656 RepID=UPI0027DD312E|nr:ROK family protein [Paludicola sp. MB14-C6]WMJ22072.1 ROK family protein [Paludicola sp. MB14-C6]